MYQGFVNLTPGFDHAASFNVMNNSWGLGALRPDQRQAFICDRDEPFFSDMFSALDFAVEQGRGGFGTSIVFAAGNSREYGDDANTSNLQNSRYVVCVGATAEDGSITRYSTPGACILVSAPGSDPATIVTTDISVPGWGYDGSSSYTFDFNGTSAAAPIVSGVIALMLEANPDLGWRDIHEILVYSARNSDPGDASWQINGATNWNGGGLHMSHDFGAGLVDAHAAVRLAESLRFTRDSSNEQSAFASSSTDVSIPDNDADGISRTLSISTEIEIDHVEVYLDIQHTYIGDLIITLISPSGTVSTLLYRIGDGVGNERVPPTTALNQQDISFLFTSTQHWGESSLGTWTLNIADVVGGDVGELLYWDLAVYGDSSSDDVYVYTDEYSTYAGSDTSRRTLSDTSGTDRLNCAAVTSNSTINLAPGSVSTIDGVALTIAPGTVIERAHAGDGDDRVTGNASSNILYGGRGNDTLSGGAGDDLLSGGAGADVFVMAAGSGNDLIQDFADGVDKINLTGRGPTFAQLGISAVAGGTLVSFGSDTVTLNGIATANVDASDFLGLAAPAVVPTTGPDTLTGTANADTIDALAGNDSVSGLGGSDSLLGNAGSDTVSGGDGLDTIVGGAGDDSLLGGAGADVFVMAAGSGNDLIQDFADGIDKIDLSGRGLTFAQLGISAVAGGTLVSFGSDTVTLNGMATANVDASDFLGLAAPAAVPTTGPDTLTGTANADTIDALAGNDSVSGLGGNDSLLGNAGSDTASGGDGADTIVGGAGDDLLSGGAGADVFVMAAGSGNDLIQDFADGIDKIDLSAYGLGGFATLTVAGVFGGVRVSFGTASIVLQGAAIASLDASDFIFQPGGNDSIVGTPNPDTLDGQDGNDSIDGLGGGDSLIGNTGDDTLIGGAGNDTLVGGEGLDTLSGGAGDDVLRGGAGADVFVLAPGGGNDFLEDFTDGIDKLDASSYGLGGFGAVSVTAIFGGVVIGLGAESITLAGIVPASIDASDFIFGGGGSPTSGPDSLAGSAAAEAIDGLGGDDTIDAGGGNDTVLGGAGTDSVAGGLGSDSIDGGAEADVLLGDRGMDTILGGVGADRLDGGDDGDSLDGGAGADTLLGAGGFDTLIGGDDGDSLSGGLGLDQIVGGGGGDTAFGGDGADSLSLGDGNDSADGGGSNDTLTGDLGGDTIFGGAGSDSLDGGTGTDSIVGGFGTDRISGGADADTLRGGEEADSVTGGDGDDALFGDSQGDTLDGGLGRDALRGGAGSDRLVGGGAADTLIGGEGADTLVGGVGADAFVYNAVGDSPVGPGLRDVLGEFEGAGVLGGDIIDLRLVDADAGAPGRQAFVFVGTSTSFTASGQLRATTLGVDTLLQGNTDGDLTDAEFEVLIQDGTVAATAYIAADFLLA